jgi:hypothetical protein
MSTVGKNFEDAGGPGRTRTYNQQIMSSTRTRNQRLARSATVCDHVPRMPCPARLPSDVLTLGSSWSGLVVGTKLGTVGTLESSRAGIPTAIFAWKLANSETCFARGKGAKRVVGGVWHGTIIARQIF